MNPKLKLVLMIAGAFVPGAARGAKVPVGAVTAGSHADLRRFPRGGLQADRTLGFPLGFVAKSCGTP
jgi:hypothetical protein